MQRALIALALGFALHAAQAATAHAAATVPAAGVIQAGLAAVQPAPPSPSRKEATNAAPMQASLQPANAADPAQREREQEPTTAMLLAALVLMVGIALRRWGSTQP